MAEIDTEVADARRELGDKHRAGLKAALAEMTVKINPKAIEALRRDQTGQAASDCPRWVDPRGDVFRVRLDWELARLRDMLIAKNQAYGNSALDPIRCFSKADATEQLRVRIDDKISRLMRGHAAGEDTVRDLVGYLVLLMMAERE